MGIMKFLILTILLGISGLSWARSDVHLHYVNFLQDSDGAEALLEALDKAEVTRAVVTGLPVIKQWQEDAPKKPRYYLGDGGAMYYYSATDAIVAEAVRDLPRKKQRRLWPLISGFNPTDMNAADHVRRMLELYPGTWRGIGEIFTRHDAISALTEGEAARADHPALLKVYRVAAQHNLPVLLHSNITSPREREPIYIGELERALAQAPHTRFIWAHAGTSATIHRFQGKLEFLPGEVERLLATYDNLWIDLSWTILDSYLMTDCEPDSQWLALIKKYPDRFVLGSDVVGRFDRIKEILDQFEPFLEALPRSVAMRVREENARRLFDKG